MRTGGGSEEPREQFNQQQTPATKTARELNQQQAPATKTTQEPSTSAQTTNANSINDQQMSPQETPISRTGMYGSSDAPMMNPEEMKRKAGDEEPNISTKRRVIE